jgi:tetratricopeptide (TPR) repeat protein
MKGDMAQKKKDGLKAVCLAGIITSFIIGGGIFFVYMLEKSAAGSLADESRFFQALKEFDTFLENSEVGTAQISRALDKLEKKALSVESLLSVLKRRRNFARKDANFLPAYQKSAQKAAARYPSSEALAVVAADSLLLFHNFTNEQPDSSAASALRVYASRISDAKYKPAALGIYVLLGDLRDPVRAQVIPEKESLFPERITQEQFAVDDAILRILAGDTASATARVNGLLGAKPSAFSKRFAAEFFYNYESPLRAAEIFSQFSDEKSIARQADALYLSGNTESARSVWTLLAGSDNAEMRVKSLYNLAATEKNPQKIVKYLESLDENLLKMDALDQPYAIYGLIRSTRLQPPEKAAAVLEAKAKTDKLAEPLIHLEILRRQRELWTADKTKAETWLLLNKYQTDQRLYEWAGWLFDFQKNYSEIDYLVKTASFYNISGSWLDFHQSVMLILAGKLDAAYERLKAFPPDTRLYAAPANMARILEAKRDMENALAYYKKAAVLESNAENAARIQFRISRCLRFLGRDEECKTALKTALSLNPGFLDARAELKRFEAF